MTYIHSRVASRDLWRMSKPYHLMVEVLYLILLLRRSIGSFSMIMSQWTLMRKPTCMYHAMVLVGENSGELEWTRCRSVCLIWAATMFHVASKSWRRSFLTELRFSSWLGSPSVEKDADSFGFDWPSVAWIRPDVIGMKSAIRTFCGLRCCSDGEIFLSIARFKYLIIVELFR